MSLDTATFELVAHRLAATDPTLGSIVGEHGTGEFWQRPPGFATLVLFVLEQQVSLASARAVYGRVREAVGGELTPAAVIASSETVLHRAGTTRQKSRYIVALADAVASGQFDLDALASLPDPEARRRLLSLTGVGPWTADVYLLAALGRPDILPVDDRALQVAAGERIGDGSPLSPVLLAEVGEGWRPWRSVAARLLWHDYLCRRGRHPGS